MFRFHNGVFPPVSLIRDGLSLNIAFRFAVKSSRYTSWDAFTQLEICISWKQSLNIILVKFSMYSMYSQSSAPYI